MGELKVPIGLPGQQDSGPDIRDIKSRIANNTIQHGKQDCHRTF
jgi:hypothetical protein